RGCKKLTVRPSAWLWCAVLFGPSWLTLLAPLRATGSCFLLRVAPHERYGLLVLAPSTGRGNATCEHDSATCYHRSQPLRRDNRHRGLILARLNQGASRARRARRGLLYTCAARSKSTQGPRPRCNRGRRVRRRR